MLLEDDAGILVVVWIVKDVHPIRLGGGRKAEGGLQLNMGNDQVKVGGGGVSVVPWMMGQAMLDDTEYVMK